MFNSTFYMPDVQMYMTVFALRSIYTQRERVQSEHERERDFWVVLSFK